MPTATLTSKGQITLPLAVRQALGLTEGQKIDFLLDGDSFRLVALKTEVSTLRGRFADRVKNPITIAQMDEAITQNAIKGAL